MAALIIIILSSTGGGIGAHYKSVSCYLAPARARGTLPPLPLSLPYLSLINQTRRTTNSSKIRQALQLTIFHNNSWNNLDVADEAGAGDWMLWLHGVWCVHCSLQAASLPRHNNYLITACNGAKYWLSPSPPPATWQQLPTPTPAHCLDTEHWTPPWRCCHLLCSTQQLIGAKIVLLSTAACFLLSWCPCFCQQQQHCHLWTQNSSLIAVHGSNGASQEQEQDHRGLWLFRTK